MNPNYSRAANYLNQIRRLRGTNACKQYFNKLAKNQKTDAINSESLTFPSFFILQPEICGHNMENQLNTRNLAAKSLSSKALMRHISKLQNSGADEADEASQTAGTFHSQKKLSYETRHTAAADSHESEFTEEEKHSALLWIFRTGAADDGLSDEYDQILDTAAAALIKKHHDKTILPALVKLIFSRNRKGAYTHDLIWTFFQTRDAQALKYIAEYLRSSNKKDIKLAQTLLNLPEITANAGRENQYRAYMSWLNENLPYIYFTGENFSLTNRPAPCDLSVSAKYLCKNISPRGKKPLVPLTETEQTYLQCFGGANENQKKTLAAYSSKIHTETPSYWSRWLQYPVEKQIQIAENGLGATL